MSDPTFDNAAITSGDKEFDATTFDPSTAGFFGICVEVGAKALFNMSYADVIKASVKFGVKVDARLVFALAFSGTPEAKKIYASKKFPDRTSTAKT